MLCIILTPDEAKQLELRYADFKALLPVELQSGEWFLPARILRDPDIAKLSKRALLEGLAIRNVLADEFANAGTWSRDVKDEISKTAPDFEKDRSA